MPDYLLWFIYLTTILSFLLAILGFFAMVCFENKLTQIFLTGKMLQFMFSIVLTVILIMQAINISHSQYLGESSYLNQGWPHILKNIH